MPQNRYKWDFKEEEATKKVSLLYLEPGMHILRYNQQV